MSNLSTVEALGYVMAAARDALEPGDEFVAAAIERVAAFRDSHFKPGGVNLYVWHLGAYAGVVCAVATSVDDARMFLSRELAAQRNAHGHIKNERALRTVWAEMPYVVQVWTGEEFERCADED